MIRNTVTPLTMVTSSLRSWAASVPRMPWNARSSTTGAKVVPHLGRHHVRQRVKDRADMLRREWQPALGVGELCRCLPKFDPSGGICAGDEPFNFATAKSWWTVSKCFAAVSSRETVAFPANLETSHLLGRDGLRSKIADRIDEPLGVELEAVHVVRWPRSMTLPDRQNAARKLPGAAGATFATSARLRAAWADISRA